jgi:imidazolonepropionase-like amidohydrolase
VRLHLLAPTLALLVAAAPSDAQTFVIRNVRVFDGDQVAQRRDVFIEDGLIRRIRASGPALPSGLQVVDGTGRTLLPGLIDSHVHLSDSAALDLRQALSLGVTTVLDMWSGGRRLEQLKALRAADATDMAALFTAGQGATAPGGHPSQMGGPPFPTIADSADADAFVRARIGEGSDYLKIIYDDLAGLGRRAPMLSRATLAALVAQAHSHALRAVVHIGTEAQARDAIDAGADGLVHLFVASSVATDFAADVVRRGAFLIPTLGVLLGVCGQPSGEAVMADTLLAPYVRTSLRPMMTRRFTPRSEPPSCEGSQATIRALASRGARIVAGTDSPVPGHTYGASLHRELELLVSAGLTPMQALTAATSAPARAFLLADRGRIESGLRADLVLIDGDPTTDILMTRRIAKVWKKGVEVKRIRFSE